jgi:hypothetical protein
MREADSVFRSGVIFEVTPSRRFAPASPIEVANF